MSHLPRHFWIGHCCFLSKVSSKFMVSRFLFFHFYAEIQLMESYIPSTARTKMNSMPSFVCSCSAHGSPSIAFHNTSHNILSLWSVSCAKQDLFSTSAKSCLHASSSNFTSCQNVWKVNSLSLRLKIVLFLSLCYLFLKFCQTIVQDISSSFSIDW